MRAALQQADELSETTAGFAGGFAARKTVAGNQRETAGVMKAKAGSAALMRQDMSVPRRFCRKIVLMCSFEVVEIEIGIGF